MLPREAAAGDGHRWHNHEEPALAFKSGQLDTPPVAVALERSKQTVMPAAQPAAGNSTLWPAAFDDPMYYRQWYLVCLWACARPAYEIIWFSVCQ